MFTYSLFGGRIIAIVTSGGQWSYRACLISSHVGFRFGVLMLRCHPVGSIPTNTRTLPYWYVLQYGTTCGFSFQFARGWNITATALLLQFVQVIRCQFLGPGLHSRILTIKEVIQEQATTNRDSSKKTDKQWSEVAGVIAAKILWMIDENKAAATQRDEAYSQEERVITLQREVAKCAKGA
jgi:hypothetical protein